MVAPNHPIGSEGHLVLMHDQDTYGKFALQFQREINVIKDESWLYRFPLCNVIIQDMLPSFVFGVYQKLNSHYIGGIKYKLPSLKPGFHTCVSRTHNSARCLKMYGHQ